MDENKGKENRINDTFVMSINHVDAQQKREIDFPGTKQCTLLV
jgi:hypothetical protein